MAPHSVCIANLLTVSVLVHLPTEWTGKRHNGRFAPEALMSLLPERTYVVLLLPLPGIARHAVQVLPEPLGTSSLTIHTATVMVDYSRHGALQLIATQRLKQPQITIATQNPQLSRA